MRKTLAILLLLVMSITVATAEPRYSLQDRQTAIIDRATAPQMPGEWDLMEIDLVIMDNQTFYFQRTTWGADRVKSTGYVYGTITQEDGTLVFALGGIVYTGRYEGENLWLNMDGQEILLYHSPVM